MNTRLGKDKQKNYREFFSRYELISSLDFLSGTDGQTGGQRVMHMNPPCKVHRWDKKGCRNDCINEE